MKKVIDHYTPIHKKLINLGVPKDISVGLKLLIQEGFESFERIYKKKLPSLLKLDNDNIGKIIPTLYSLQIEYEHLGWHIKDAKKSFSDIERYLDKLRGIKRKDKPILTRKGIIKKLENKLNKKISVDQLAKWVNQHIDDRYEKGSQKIMDEVLVDLAMNKKLGLKLSDKDFKEMVKKLKK